MRPNGTHNRAEQRLGSGITASKRLLTDTACAPDFMPGVGTYYNHEVMLACVHL